MSESHQVNKLLALMVFSIDTREFRALIYFTAAAQDISLLIRSVPRTASDPQLQPIELDEPWYLGNNILGLV